MRGKTVQRETRPRAFAAICIAWKTSEKKEVALIKRRDDHPHHLSGRWFVPGGAVAKNEHPSRTAARETLEECGITVKEPTLLDVYELTEYWEHGGVSFSQPVILAVYEAFYAKGTLRPVEECTAAEWVAIKNIHKYVTADTKKTHLSVAVRRVLGLKAK